MVTNLIEKHGVMPKQCFPDTISCESSRHMNTILKSKLREFAHDLYLAVSTEEDENQISSRIKDQMKTIFR